MPPHLLLGRQGNTASGPRQHYLPAAVIGRFAPGPSHPLTPARNRKVWVLRRNRIITQQAATTVAYQNNLYATGDPTVNVDALLSYYEQHANPAIDALHAEYPGPYRLDTWMKVATYIAAAFARTPDFPTQLWRRLGHTPGDGLDHIFTKHAASGVRFLEYFRVSAAIARAHWTILHSPAHPLILNDRGATAMNHNGVPGYLIPLRPTLAAVLEHGPYDKNILWIGSTWRIDISAHALNTAQAEHFNTATWLQCRREVYASNQNELRRLQQHNPPPPHPDITAAAFDGAALLGLTRRQRMDSEILLQQIAQGIPPPPDPNHPPIIRI